MSASLLRILKKQTYGYKPRNKTKLKIKGFRRGCWGFGFFSCEIHKFNNLFFCIFKRWRFRALKFRERILKGTYSSAKAGVPIQIKEQVLYGMAYLITEEHDSDRNPAEQCSWTLISSCNKKSPALQDNDYICGNQSLFLDMPRAEKEAKFKAFMWIAARYRTTCIKV